MQSNHAIKTIFVILTIILSIATSKSQVGISAHYSSFDESTFSERFEQGQIDQLSAVSVSLDYWFRLKQKRLEFLPTFYFTSYGGDYNVKNYGFQFRATVYPFDFAGDCNCPTFSKENDLIKKGFFIRLAPGIGNWTASAKHINGFEESEDLSDLIPEVSLGVGLDIGITNLLTISPEVRYRQIFSGTWNGQANFTFDGFGVFEPGVRIGLRFDKKNYGFKRPKRRRRR